VEALANGVKAVVDPWRRGLGLGSMLHLYISVCVEVEDDG